MVSFLGRAVKYPLLIFANFTMADQEKTPCPEPMLPACQPPPPRPIKELPKLPPDTQQLKAQVPEKFVIPCPEKKIVNEKGKKKITGMESSPFLHDGNRSCRRTTN